MRTAMLTRKWFYIWDLCQGLAGGNGNWVALWIKQGWPRESEILDPWWVTWVYGTLSTDTGLKFCMVGCEEKGSNQILASISSSTPSCVVLFAFYFVHGSLPRRCNRSKERREKDQGWVSCSLGWISLIQKCVLNLTTGVTHLVQRLRFPLW